jgi:hypothetical protein
MKLAPALVPLEAWFWYMLFLDLLSAKPSLAFLLELIEQIIHTIKFGEIRLYAHNGAIREIETSEEKSDVLFWRSCCVD